MGRPEQHAADLGVIEGHHPRAVAKERQPASDRVPYEGGCFGMNRRQGLGPALANRAQKMRRFNGLLIGASSVDLEDAAVEHA